MRYTTEYPIKLLKELTCLRVGPVFENVPRENRRGYCTENTIRLLPNEQQGPLKLKATNCLTL